LQSAVSNSKKFEAVHFDSATFEEERKAFLATGKARLPDDSGTYINGKGQSSSKGSLKKPNALTAPQAAEAEVIATKKRKHNGKKNGDVERILASLPSADDGSQGIWAVADTEEKAYADNKLSDEALGTLSEAQHKIRDERAEIARLKDLRNNAENKAETSFDQMIERKLAHLLPPRLGGDNEGPCKASTKFHGASLYDYQGRSWTTPPAGLRQLAEGDDTKSFLPKKAVHRYTGHTKGVHAVRFAPGTGHLLLSAGLDGKCKVWSVYGERRCLRTYDGHTAGVRDVQWTSDSKRFLSASFDRYIRLWDTESGEVINTFTNRRVPYCVKFYPNDENIFVVGCSDNKAVAYNATTGEIVQEYNHHLAAVNTITFIENVSRVLID
jgi:pre-mRNA-processing factor 17